eukprot:gb/GECG01007016.1/.p1 GENE.gb/GECG01007016.1/~~gb/GECG01007016.1/.p1  ORF type:complete len:198 (+),score=22.55 gb/GECG01007016.1/:1-594(+)
MATARNPVEIHTSSCRNGNYVMLLWDVDDIEYLRRECRIPLSAVGHLSQGSKEATLPCIVHPLEACLCVQHGYAVVNKTDGTVVNHTCTIAELVACFAVQKDKYALYVDLWKQGYWVTSGIKFGGDFLVYEDDPTNVHAGYIVALVPPSYCETRLLEIASKMRVGVATSKKLILATVENVDGNGIPLVTYSVCKKCF